MSTNLPLVFHASHFDSTKTKFQDPVKFPPDSITKLRATESYELELFLQDGGISYLNGQGCARKNGLMIFALPNDKRQSSLHFASIILRFETLDPMLQEFFGTLRGFHYSVDFDAAYAFFQEICTLTNDYKTDQDIRAAAKLLLFLCDLKKTAEQTASDSTDTEAFSVVSKAANYMKEHYMEELHVAQIAEYCSISSSYFHKIFQDVMHTTPNEYLLLLRLTHAKTLLAETKKSVSEIAALCGFNSLAYFSASFKKHFSYSPKEYRNSVKYPDI